VKEHQSNTATCIDAKVARIVSTLCHICLSCIVAIIA